MTLRKVSIGRSLQYLKQLRLLLLLGLLLPRALSNSSLSTNGKVLARNALYCGRKPPSIPASCVCICMDSICSAGLFALDASQAFLRVCRPQVWRCSPPTLESHLASSAGMRLEARPYMITRGSCSCGPTCFCHLSAYSASAANVISRMAMPASLCSTALYSSQLMLWMHAGQPLVERQLQPLTSSSAFASSCGNSGCACAHMQRVRPPASAQHPASAPSLASNARRDRSFLVEFLKALCFRSRHGIARRTLVAR